MLDTVFSTHQIATKELFYYNKTAITKDTIEADIEAFSSAQSRVPNS